MRTNRLLCLAPFVLLASVAALTVEAQDADLTPHSTDLVIRVVNAAEGTIVPAEQVLVRVQGALLDKVAEARNIDGEVSLAAVEIFNFKPYLISAWVDGVAYHTRIRGQEFMDGKVAVVNTFDTTDSTEGVTVTGMNVVVRRREDGFQVEYVATIDNQSRPQRTVLANVLPVQLSLPAGVELLKAEVDNGPEPFDVPTRVAGKLIGVAVPLTPGEARVTVTGEVRTGDKLQFDVASNLPVAAWSLLTWPNDLRVYARGLEEDRDHDYAGFGRWIGEALEPSDQVSLEITVPTADDAEPVFTETAPSTPEPTRPAAESREVPWVTIIVAAVLLGIYGLWRFRR